MRRRFGYVAVPAAVIWLASCADLGIDDFKYACQRDEDCGEGFTCDRLKGCVRVAMPTDAGGVTRFHPRDAGPRDAGPHFKDVGVVFFRLPSVYDHSVGTPAPDGGVPAGGGIVARSVTGWSAAPSMVGDAPDGGKMVLRRTMMFSRPAVSADGGNDGAGDGATDGASDGSEETNDGGGDI
ncbi:MAG: hypothetical protein HY897_04660 [Deltaproteobacteria bacterium]|nr:hypothetical protein [Deltaproteobacteria bacterium]